MACDRPAGSHCVRGRCPECYWLAWKCVREGYTTWKFLESVGFARSLAKRQARPKIGKRKGATT